MKIMHVNVGDTAGGASRAAYRIHKALVQSGCDSYMRVFQKGSTDERVISGFPHRSAFDKIVGKLQNEWLKYASRGLNINASDCYSFGLYSSGLIRTLYSTDADVLNLHWVADMLSVKDIGVLKKPIVWTLHDMWAFCGCEHYVKDEPSSRFQKGYLSNNRAAGESGSDLNRKTWEAKCRAWAHQRFTIVSPSCWLAECARNSVIFADAEIRVIPNALDTSTTWLPIACNVARVALGLPPDKKLILMGAVGGVEDPRKGGDLLRDTLAQVVLRLGDTLELIIYGQGQPAGSEPWPCPVHWMGKVNNDRLLALAYSAADLMVVPSRQDNLPNTAVEAQACGTPVAAFNIGGLPDIVTHRKTGWLARPYDTEDLAEGILWVLEGGERHSELSFASRRQAVERFSEPIIAKAYRDLYEKVLAEHSVVK